MLKKAVRAILPQHVMNAARDMRSRKKLASVMPLPFSSAGLTKFTKADIDIYFDHPDAFAHWEEDHKVLEALLGDDDRWGAVNPGDRRAIYTLIMAAKSKQILEIGTHIGASTLHLAKALEHSGGHITTVDILDVNADNGPWQDIGMMHCPKDFVEKLHLSDSVTFVTDTSIRYLNSCTEMFDFIFLDGDHAADTVYREISAALEKIEKGGMILLHDYYPDGKPLFTDGRIICGPFRALERISKEHCDIDVLNLSPLPWETKQGGHNTSLSIVIKV